MTILQVPGAIRVVASNHEVASIRVVAAASSAVIAKASRRSPLRATVGDHLVSSCASRRSRADGP